MLSEMASVRVSIVHLTQSQEKTAAEVTAVDRCKYSVIITRHMSLGSFRSV